ncbi:hypothetical protein ISF_08009 [Cordyceps fumosorosea ARSEF 2679]|uniref:Endoplasmic reticulum junction formation protein lunapark n=1 Tax=Cordyceps fumosorosea (strain ARSEF 2679) TaxID=1081104 RepID=A0A167N3H7_CORFA|nr:hypothetical protein ISF_08009 [Cordyceps fumosorosea ARSEF 2679]OAA55088.1 hypothetical protein ISF_08009 [Cordyceps fumosorosea ARSEF 2679]
MDGFLDWVSGTGPSPFAGIFGQGLAQRSNTPSGAYDQILTQDTSAAEQNNRLWAVDRILEVQTVPHFLEFAITGELLSGGRTSLPLLGDNFEYIQVPMSEWAPAPYSRHEISTMEAIMQSIGSTEDSSRLVPITKELLAMKARVWEGIMPLSERRWTELDLDSPTRFHEACQFISAVTNVFHYLNIPGIKVNLRETYNLIWGHLDTFDKALHALGADKTDADFSMAALWHEYIEDHFDSISTSSHRWVIEHIQRLRAPILQLLSQNPNIGHLEEDDTYGASLADLIHDLHEGAAQADSGIFLQTDGFHGAAEASQDNVPGNASYRYREQPISFSASTEKRKADYYFRVRYLSHMELFKMENLLENSENSVRGNAKDQIQAEMQARQELRGSDTRMDEPPRWVAQARRHLSEGGSLQWGFIGFRTSHDHSDADWEQFKANFEADISDWGSELGDVDDLRAVSKVQWRDAEGAIDGIPAAEKEFAALNTDEELMEQFHDDIFLIADKVAIDSYIGPNAMSGHILAVEAGFDVNHQDPERVVESPGYQGWLRLPGSLLWDDLGAVMLMQTQHLMELWPLAEDDAAKVGVSAPTGRALPDIQFNMVPFWPWGADNTSPASFEKTLSALSSKITTTQTTLDKTRASARRVKVLLVLYLGFAYLVYAIVQLVVVKYWNMGALEWAGMAGVPLFIVLVRKLSGAYFSFRTDSLSRRLKTQQEERAKTIQKLKDATKYDSTMELIEKYGGEKKKEVARSETKDGEQSHQPTPHAGAPNRTRLPPPPTANIPNRGPPAGVSDSGPSSVDSSALEPGAEFAPNAFSHSAPPQPQPQVAHYTPGPPETHWYDRIFDVLLGEDETLPKNRIVLLCHSCRLVNGQAPPGTRSLSELGVWRCAACHATNGAVDEGKRIVDEVLASAQQGSEGSHAKVDAASQQDDKPVDLGDIGEKESAATGVEKPDGATTKRRAKGK